MIISIINFTNESLSDEEIQKAIRAINRQIKEDFEPYWSMGACLRLEGKIETNLNKENPVDIRGDAVIYIKDTVDDVKNALGYHDKNYHGIPYGFVFADLVKQYNENWTATLSHEALELIGDPEVNLLAAGPHPENPNKEVFHWYEMCDAVQNETYKIDEIEVSNFVLPLYFTTNEEEGSRNDFLGRKYNGKTLKSFGVNPGGYVGFYDPSKKEHDTYSMKGDKRAEERMIIKTKAAGARRAIRYQNIHKNN
ncbi:MAG: hypothetical protein OEV44_03925 [Spirochaetota bacterium]|nr:hypothetical protein [Spirochaetota bacterium]